MKFVRYVRKSTDGDERQFHSLADQESVLLRLETSADLTVVDRISESRSAKMPGTRPGFETMLQEITDGKADAILCWNFSRLSRNPVDSGRLQWMLQEGIIQCIKTPEREYRPEDNVLLMAVESAVANQDIRTLRHNIKRTQNEKAQRGWYPYRPKNGYRTNRETREIEADGESFHLLKRAWGVMLTGCYTVPQILDQLTGWGYRVSLRKGGIGVPLKRSRLYEIFHDRFYMGEFEYDGRVLQGKHPPMVSREEFERVQRLLGRPGHIQPQKHEFPFTGLIRCGHCGCMVTAECKVKRYPQTNRTVSYTYYHCTHNKGCRAEAVRGAYVEDCISDTIAACRLDASFAPWAHASLEGRSDKKWNDREKALAGHQADVEAARHKMQGLLDLRLAGELSPEEFKTMRGQIERQIAQGQLAVERLQRHAERRHQTITNLVDFAVNGLERFKADTHDKKRMAAQTIGSGYVLTQGQLTFQVHRLLQPLYGIGALEPTKHRTHQVRNGIAVPKNPELWAALDRIRTLIDKEDVRFPEWEETSNQEESNPLAFYDRLVGQVIRKRGQKHNR